MLRSHVIRGSILSTFLLKKTAFVMGVRRLFPGEGKFSRDGKNILFALKKLKVILFSFKKIDKHTFLVGQGRGGGQVPPLALPCGRP
jgi:hypothetical protein